MNKVKFGLENVHVSKITEDAQGNITYGAPFAMPGAVGLNADPSGDTKVFWADNTKYYIANQNNGYEGDLEVAIAIKQFLTQILGQEEDDNGALIESADDINARFALMGEIKGDEKNRRFVYYDCTATRPKSESKTTEDTKDPQTDTLSITMSPRKTDKVIKAVLELSDSNSAVYNTFFDDVYEKNSVISG